MIYLLDANVLIDIDHLDLGSSILEPLRPLRTHLTLADGELLLRDLDARTGQGRLGGAVQLDGRNDQALWSADLRWAGVPDRRRPGMTGAVGWRRVRVLRHRRHRPAARPARS